VATLAQAANPTLERLEDQARWYSRKSRQNARFYKWLKAVTIISAACVPALTTRLWSAPYAGALGVIIVVAEGLQQLNQFHANWLAYRSTAEALKREKYLYLAQAGPYASVPNPLPLLAERVEGLVSQENAKWISTQQESGKKSSQAVSS
jgi:hypothetical protein